MVQFLGPTPIRLPIKWNEIWGYITKWMISRILKWLWTHEDTHWTYSVAFAPDIERGIQIFWTANLGAVSKWTILKEEKDCGYQANNYSLGNGCAIHGSKNLNAMFNVGGKSNWVRPLCLITSSESESEFELESESCWPQSWVEISNLSLFQRLCQLSL